MTYNLTFDPEVVAEVVVEGQMPGQRYSCVSRPERVTVARDHFSRRADVISG